ncbi:MAG: penicillin-binding protein activator LpoB [Nitrospirae bacterium]|nr:penicillin-binding protein activator LpoB [Nitrospirota bacterium]
MKKLQLFLLACLLFVFASSTLAAEKPRLGVLRFTNNTHAGWWKASVGHELQDMLASELASTKSFQVLERKEIDAVLGEQDLGKSGRVDKKTRAKIGKIKGAKYLVAATVSAYEEDTSGTGGGIGIGGFSVGGKSEKAYMAVDLKIIDTTTGEIVDARTVEATSSSSGLNLAGHVGIFSGSLGKYEKTPTGKAIRACIIEISDYLACSLVKGKNDECMSEYAAKESSRRDKTKKSISLE